MPKAVVKIAVLNLLRLAITMVPPRKTFRDCRKYPRTTELALAPFINRCGSSEL